MTLWEMEREFRRAVLRHHLDAADWNVTHAARDLGVSRNQFYVMLRDLKFDLTKERLRDH